MMIMPSGIRDISYLTFSNTGSVPFLVDAADAFNRWEQNTPQRAKSFSISPASQDFFRDETADALRAIAATIKADNAGERVRRCLSLFNNAYVPDMKMLVEKALPRGKDDRSYGLACDFIQQAVDKVISELREASSA